MSCVPGVFDYFVMVTRCPVPTPCGRGRGVIPFLARRRPCAGSAGAESVTARDLGGMRDLRWTVARRPGRRARRARVTVVYRHRYDDREMSS